MSDPQNPLVPILEAILLSAGRPLSLPQLAELFPEASRPGMNRLREALRLLETGLEGRGVELKKVASGFRLQVRTEYSGYIARMQVEKAPRYSRALLETLVLIAYRQPITRGEIEEVRGVGVSTQIMRTLLEREWVRVVGHREVPGRPGLYATTRQFLDYFNLESLDQLPPLAELRDLEAQAADAGIEGAEDMSGSVASSALVQPDEAAQQAAEESSEQFFAELDALEEELPGNFEELLKGHFALEVEEAVLAEPPLDDEPIEAEGEDTDAEAPLRVPRSLFADDD